MSSPLYHDLVTFFDSVFVRFFVCVFDRVFVRVFVRVLVCVFVRVFFCFQPLNLFSHFAGQVKHWMDPALIPYGWGLFSEGEEVGQIK